MKQALAPVDIERDPAQVYLAGLSVNSRRAMVGKLQNVAAILGYSDLRAIRWSDMRYEHVTAIRTRIAETKSPATVNATISALRGVARESWRLGLISTEDRMRIEAVNGLKGSRLPSGRALALGEINALFDVCALDPSPAGARDAAILALLLGAGLRRAECAALLVEDYDSQAQSVKVVGKGNKERMCYLEAGADQAVRDWLMIRGSWSGPLLCSVRKDGRIEHKGVTAQAIYKTLTKRGKNARISHFSPHDLRRTFASVLIEASGDLSTVQKLMGHANVETTVGYDRRGELTKKRVSGMVHVPYRSRFD
jgi:site-specific recombinase XerC